MFCDDIAVVLTISPVVDTAIDVEGLFVVVLSTRVVRVCVVVLLVVVVVVLAVVVVGEEADVVFVFVVVVLVGDEVVLDV